MTWNAKVLRRPLLVALLAAFLSIPSGIAFLASPASATVVCWYTGLGCFDFQCLPSDKSTLSIVPEEDTQLRSFKCKGPMMFNPDGGEDVEGGETVFKFSTVGDFNGDGRLDMPIRVLGGMGGGAGTRSFWGLGLPCGDYRPCDDPPLCPPECLMVKPKPLPGRTATEPPQSTLRPTTRPTEEPKSTLPPTTRPTEEPKSTLAPTALPTKEPPRS